MKCKAFSIRGCSPLWLNTFVNSPIKTQWISFMLLNTTWLNYKVAGCMMNILQLYSSLLSAQFVYPSHRHWDGIQLREIFWIFTTVLYQHYGTCIALYYWQHDHLNDNVITLKQSQFCLRWSFWDETCSSLLRKTAI